MNVFDQSARYAAQADPVVVPHRLTHNTGVSVTWLEWLDTRTVALPGGAERIADLVALLSDQSKRLWLQVLEFQAQVDLDKLDVTFEEVALLRARARHGPERKDKYCVMAGLVYLVETCPEEVLDMTLPNGQGTRHAPLVWNIGQDDAAATLEAVAEGRWSWGMLFWVPLMRGGNTDAVITRWKEVVTQQVEDKRRRGDLADIALVFAELTRCVPAWRRGLEGFEMTESQVVNEWVNRGETKGNLQTKRRDVVRLVGLRFPGQSMPEVIQLINQQESMPILEDWFDSAATVLTFEEFVRVLKQ